MSNGERGGSRKRDLRSRVGRNTSYKGHLFPFTCGFRAEISSEAEQNGILQRKGFGSEILSSGMFIVGQSVGPTHSARINIKLFTELHGTVNFDQFGVGWVCDDSFDD